MYLSLLTKFDVALFFIDCSFSQLYTEKFLNVHENTRRNRVDNAQIYAQIYINMGFPWENTHFLYFLHNEIQVTF